MRPLNRDHLGHDEVTDVLAFPLENEEELAFGGPGEPVVFARNGDVADDEAAREVPRLLGDVVVCPHRAAAQARAAGTPLAFEMAMLLVHGTLHVLGYDHEADAGEMAAAPGALPRRRRLGATAWRSLTAVAARSCRASTTPSTASSTWCARSATCRSTSRWPSLVLVAAFFFDLDRLEHRRAVRGDLVRVHHRDAQHGARVRHRHLHLALRPAGQDRQGRGRRGRADRHPERARRGLPGLLRQDRRHAVLGAGQGAPDADRRDRHRGVPAAGRGDRRQGRDRPRHAAARRPALRSRRRGLRRLGGDDVHRRRARPSPCPSR